MTNPRGLLPVAAVVGAAALGASSGLFIKGSGLSSLALAGFRMGVPFLLVLPFLLGGGRWKGLPGHRTALWTASALNAVRLLLFTLAFKLTAIGNAVVLLYLWPVFAVVFEGLWNRRPPTLVQAGLLVLAFGGVVLMNLHRDFSAAGSDLWGSAVMVLSAALYAVTTLLFKRALDHVPETHTMFFQNAVGAVVLLPFLAAELPGASLGDWGAGLAYGFVVGFLAFGLFFFAMKRLPLFQYSALSYAEVPFAVLLGVTLAGESLVWNQGVGAVLVVTASVLARALRVSPATSRTHPR